MNSPEPLGDAVDRDITAYDFQLPDSAIAQRPATRREGARLFVLDRQTGSCRHRRVRGLIHELDPGDLLVRNITKVFPARLLGERDDTGGRVEALLLRRETGTKSILERGAAAGPDGADSGETWSALVRPARRLRPGIRLRFGANLEAVVGGAGLHGVRYLCFGLSGAALRSTIEKIGEIPLPPYIRRAADSADRRRYQTVFASSTGSVAAPTAGLHFTPGLLERLEQQGIEVADLVLHVGPGTFRPVSEGGIADHRMDPEPFDLPVATAHAIENARRRGARVVAVGTTVARVLEARARPGGLVQPGKGATGLFIHPPYQFRVVDALMTNFHLPRSTLLMLVSALAGREAILAAYAEAIDRGYRFYSYGDAMLIR